MSRRIPTRELDVHKPKEVYQSSRKNKSENCVIECPESYDVDPKTTQVLIINNDKFKKNVVSKKRHRFIKNSETEALDFKEVLKNLGIPEDNIKYHNNLSQGEMIQKIEAFRESIRKSCSLIIVAVLSHGGENGAILATDARMDFKNTVIDPFLGKQCKNLMGKPKIFIPEICRGNEDEEISHNNTQTRADLLKQDFSSLPANADILMCYPTSKNTVAYVGGFLKHLTHAIDKFIVQEKLNYDMAQILAIVCNHVCNLTFGNNKMVPTYQSTLRRQLFLVKYKDWKECTTRNWMQLWSFSSKCAGLAYFVIVVVLGLLIKVFKNL